MLSRMRPVSTAINSPDRRMNLAGIFSGGGTGLGFDTAGSLCGALRFQPDGVLDQVEDPVQHSTVAFCHLGSARLSAASACNFAVSRC